MTVDLSDVAAQVQGFYNSGITTGHACSQVAFKCITSPTDYPINDGSFRNLKAVVPPGRVISAVKPAPMRWWMTFPMTIVDTVFKALTPAIPERTIAGHHADLVIGMLNGINPKNNEFYIAFIGPTGGGWGASRTKMGSAPPSASMTAIPITARPSSRSKYPFLIENYALREDSGGAGEYRGGLGCENTVQARADFMLNAQVERMHCKPWGLNGGKEAAGNAVVLRAGGTWKRIIRTQNCLRPASSRAMLSRCARAGGRLRRSAQTAGRNRCGRCASGICQCQIRAKRLRRRVRRQGQPERRCDRKATSRQLTKSVQW